jgi:hypothetical protein
MEDVVVFDGGEEISLFGIEEINLASKQRSAEKKKVLVSSKITLLFEERILGIQIYGPREMAIDPGFPRP